MSTVTPTATHLLRDAIDEIRMLQRVNEILEAKVQTFEMCFRFLQASEPPDRRVYSEDVASKLEREIERLNQARASE